MANNLKERLNLQLKRKTEEKAPDESESGTAPHDFTPIPSVDAIHGTNTSLMKKMNYLELDPERCRPWKYHNRSRSWFSRKEQTSLNESLRRDGQQQLGLVRIVENDPDYNHEIIFGVRRNEGCRAERLKFKARVLPADTPDSVCVQYMHVENKESQDVSDLEEARNYRLLLRDGVFTNGLELGESLSLSKSRVSQLIKAAELFDYEWLSELIEPILMDVSIRSATMIARALGDPNKLRNARNHAKKIKELGTVISGDELQAALLGERKAKSASKRTKTVLVKKGRNNLVEMHSDAEGALSLTVKPYERSDEEKRELISQIVTELEGRL